MRFQPESLHGANAGLNVARDLMEKIKKEFEWITYGDLWTLAGVAAVQVCRAASCGTPAYEKLIQEMQGPKIPWRPGRIDGFAESATPDGRLPNATLGADHLRNVSPQPPSDSTWPLNAPFQIFYRMGYGYPPPRAHLMLNSIIQLQRPGDSRSLRRPCPWPLPH